MAKGNHFFGLSAFKRELLRVPPNEDFLAGTSNLALFTLGASSTFFSFTDDDSFEVGSVFTEVTDSATVFVSWLPPFDIETDDLLLSAVTISETTMSMFNSRSLLKGRRISNSDTTGSPHTVTSNDPFRGRTALTTTFRLSRSNSPFNSRSSFAARDLNTPQLRQAST
eukprot:gene4987-6937_t